MHLGPSVTLFRVGSLIFPAPKVKVKKNNTSQIEFVHSIYSVPNKLVQESDRKCTISDKRDVVHICFWKKNNQKTESGIKEINKQMIEMICGDYEQYSKSNVQKKNNPRSRATTDLNKN